MDYYEIGQRIRKVRKAQHMSQEKLADLTDISVTHMSHIETGNTKLSLAVFEKITVVLGVQADVLLFGDARTSKVGAVNRTIELLESCDAQQVALIADIIKSTKVALDMYY